MDYYSAVKKRRTIYTLSRKSSIPDGRIQEILKDALLHAPTPFHGQFGRIILLLEKSHDELWDAIKEVLRKMAVNPEAFAKTEEKIAGFKNAYGTVLFFNDTDVVKKFQNDYPLYRDAFAEWSLVASGMLEHIVWTSFAMEGMGASLQHYNPLIDEWVAGKTGAPKNWKLLAQMPFGVPAADAPPKEFLPLDTRFKVMR